MATKQWRLDVTEIGSDAPLFSVAVDADNWMVALRRARTAIQQPGGVPTGSSCAVAPDGKVTILDPVDRRRFVLTPSTAADFKPVPVASPAPVSTPAPAAPVAVTPVAPKPGPAPAKFSSWPPAPSSSAPSAAPAPQPVTPAKRASTPAPAKPASIPAPHPYASPVQAPTKKDFKKTMAYVPNDPAPAKPTPKKVPKRTMAYMPAMDIEALKKQAQLENAQEAKEQAAMLAAQKVAAAEQAAKDAKAALAAAEAAKQKAAQEAKAAQDAAAAEAKAAQEAEAAKALANKAVEEAKAQKAKAKTPMPSSPPPPAAGLIPKAIPKKAILTPELPHAEQLFERNADPTEANPLRYRERIFLVPESCPREQAEALLRARLEELKLSLSDAPAGKFVNLAVFDHRWEGQPLRPPIVTLQWKDWAGDPVIDFPMVPTAEPQTASPSAPVSPPATQSAETAVAQPEADFAVSEPDDDRPRQRFPTGDQDARLTHAFEASQDLLFLETPADGMEFVVRLLGELISSEAANALIYDINHDEFRFLNCSGPGHAKRHGKACPSRSGLIGVGMGKGGKAVALNALSEVPSFDPKHPELIGISPKNALVVAVEHNGQLHGALQLLNRTGHPFMESDADLVTFIANQLGQFLQQCRSKMVG